MNKKLKFNISSVFRLITFFALLCALYVQSDALFKLGVRMQVRLQRATMPPPIPYSDWDDIDEYGRAKPNAKKWTDCMYRI